MSPGPTDSANGGARGASFNAAKGAVVIGVAIVIGAVLLQTVHSSTARSATTTTPTTHKPPAHTTTTTAPHSNGTTATTAPATGPVKTPDQLRVLVLNGGAAAGTAKTMTQTLSQKGYTNHADANTWTGHQQQGNTVLCRAGLDREAAALATTVGNGTPVAIAPFPTPAPPFSDGPPPADCVVVVGS